MLMTYMYMYIYRQRIKYYYCTNINNMYSCEWAKINKDICTYGYAVQLHNVWYTIVSLSTTEQEDRRHYLEYVFGQFTMSYMCTHMVDHNYIERQCEIG